MTTAPVSASAPEAPPLSQGARIIDSFIAPSKTFSDLKRNASWWAPWLLIAVFSLIFIYTIDRQIGFEQITRNEIAKSPSRAEQFEKLPPDQQARQIRISVVFTKVFSYGSPVIALIAYLVIAAVLMGTFNLVLGTSVRFAVALAIVIYGSLPSIFAALLGVISLIAGGMSGSLDKEAFNIRNAVASNPAYFMDPTGNKFLYGMASALDVFVIWNIVLMGIGFSCNSKIKRGTAIAVVAGWYVFYKLVGAGLAVAFS
jgi:Yip1-like protein